MSALEKLVSIASSPICDSAPKQVGSGNWPGLMDLLELRNGFLAFESALVVFPSQDAGGVQGIDNWNDASGWRKSYSDVLTSEFSCFAHDLFGGQFAVSKHGIVKFDPETGAVSMFARSLEEWAHAILADYPMTTGWPLAHEWQRMNRPLSASERLLPKQPFVFGGDYVVENMVPIGSLEAMAKWGRLYLAIRAVPDGRAAPVTDWM